MELAQSNKRRAQIFIGLLLTFGVGNLPIGTLGERLTGPGHLAGHEILWWVAVAVLLAYVSVVERKPYSSIGFHRLGLRDIPFALVAGILMVVGIVMIYSLVFPALHLRMNTGVVSRLMATPFWYRFLLVTRAAVSEETLFRGYPIERLEELAGSRLLAGGLSWAAFTVAHLSGWGWPQLIVAGFGGLLLTGLYLWRRNLWANMIAHWVADGAGFLLPH